jgi:hypothetical protein
MTEYLTSSYDHLFIFINLIAILATLFVLCLYTKATYRMANQSQESNLRPVVLRSGFIRDWNDLAPTFRNANREMTLPGTPIQFTILKNIAMDIMGYIIINHFKYQLLFGNDISKIRADSGSSIAILSFEPKWGWMQPNSIVYALFAQDTSEETKEENKIHIDYKDIEGNSYYTIENVHFSQNTYKL